MKVRKPQNSIGNYLGPILLYEKTEEVVTSSVSASYLSAFNLGVGGFEYIWQIGDCISPWHSLLGASRLR